MLNLARLPAVTQLIDMALAEDLERGDVTTQTVLSGPRKDAVAHIVAREPLVLFGSDVALSVFEKIDPRVAVQAKVSDGESAPKGQILMEVNGPADSILMAERTVLNFLQRLSGVATLSKRYATAVAGSNARVVDTRKTTPGYRLLEKAAVLAGGCGNHRFDLGSGVLIKDNHIVACGSLSAAVAMARQNAPHPLRIEVEVDSLSLLDQAIAAKADIVLLDNMTPEQAKEACARAHAAGILVEVSGGINLETVAVYARTGADFISVGALTHSAKAVDIALDFAPNHDAAQKRAS